MNNSSNFFKLGVKKGFKSLRSFSFLEKLILTAYIFASIPFRFILFTKPIIAVADVNIGKAIDNDDFLSIGRIFSNTMRRNRYLELLTFYFFTEMILGGLLVIINLPAVFAFIFGSLSSYYSTILVFAIVMVSFTGIITLILDIGLSLYLSPAAFVSSQGEKGFFSDILHNSYHGVKHHFGSLLGIYVKYCLFFLAILVPTLGIALVIFIFGGVAGVVVGSLLVAIFLILSVLLYPSIYCSFQTSKYMYYKKYVSTKHNYYVRSKEEALNIDEEDEDEDEDEDEAEDEQ